MHLLWLKRNRKQFQHYLTTASAALITVQSAFPPTVQNSHVKNWKQWLQNELRSYLKEMPNMCMRLLEWKLCFLSACRCGIQQYVHTGCVAPTELKHNRHTQIHPRTQTCTSRLRSLSVVYTWFGLLTCRALFNYWTCCPDRQQSLLYSHLLAEGVKKPRSEIAPRVSETSAAKNRPSGWLLWLARQGAVWQSKKTHWGNLRCTPVLWMSFLKKVSH